MRFFLARTFQVLSFAGIVVLASCQNPFAEKDDDDKGAPSRMVNYALVVAWESSSIDSDVLHSVSTKSLTSSAASAVDVGTRNELWTAKHEATDSVIVKYKDGNVPGTMSAADAVRGLSSSTVSVGRTENFVRYTVDPSVITVDQLVSDLNTDPNVEYAEPDYKRYALGVPNDPGFPMQWNLQQLSMSTLWNTITGDENVVVAVIDTGVAYDLSDFSTTIFVPGWDFVNNDADPYDDNAHGTHVAGTIAQSTNNGAGVAGMAYGVSIMPLKTLGQDGSGYVSDTSEAIIWAVDNGADVINLSLGSTSSSTTEEAAVKYAFDNGVPVIAATGNDNGAVNYPAAYDAYVLAVGATRYDKARSPYSNFGPEVDIVAPGGDMTVDQNADGYNDGILQQTIGGFDPGTGVTDYTAGFHFFQGTSMATPHVAALAALVMSKNPFHTTSEVYNLITGNADDLGTAGRDDEYGHGLINPIATLGASEWGVFDTHTGSFSVGTEESATFELDLDESEFRIALLQQASQHGVHISLYDRNGTLIDKVENNSTSKFIDYSGGTGNAPFRVELRFVQ